MQETWVLSLPDLRSGRSPGEENCYPPQCSCLECPLDRGAWQAAVHGVTKSRTRLSNFTFTFHFSLSCIGEGNGNPLQCSCLENPRDGRAWWAAVYGVAQSQTRLKRLSSSSSSRVGERRGRETCVGYLLFYKHSVSSFRRIISFISLNIL